VKKQYGQSPAIKILDDVRGVNNWIYDLFQAVQSAPFRCKMYIDDDGEL
jgi:hypothetical protein